MAAAGFLHSLYNGLESCMSRIAHGVDESVPAGGDFHKLLIDQLSAAIDGVRPALLDPALARRINEYRGFRHAFRHMYFFDLDWTRVRPLMEGTDAIQADFEAAVGALLTAVGPA
jgi:hypothetical protein